MLRAKVIHVFKKEELEIHLNEFLTNLEDDALKDIKISWTPTSIICMIVYRSTSNNKIPIDIRENNGFANHLINNSAIVGHVVNGREVKAGDLLTLEDVKIEKRKRGRPKKNES